MRATIVITKLAGVAHGARLTDLRAVFARHGIQRMGAYSAGRVSIDGQAGSVASITLCHERLAYLTR